jgi:hypothetical protein
VAVDLAKAEYAIDQSFINIKAVFSGNLDDMTAIVDLFEQIRKVQLDLMVQHVNDLSEALKKLKAS